jgi:hypothetical protein
MKGILRAIGVVLVVAGVLLLCLVGFSIYLAQQNCEGGLSPQPPQGCGYVIHLAFYVWGESYSILYAIIALALGLAVLVFARSEAI